MSSIEEEKILILQSIKNLQETTPKFIKNDVLWSGNHLLLELNFLRLDILDLRSDIRNLTLAVNNLPAKFAKPIMKGGEDLEHQSQ